MDRENWVEIVEPLSRDYIYINLETGECLWEPPKDTCFKKCNESEWWELYDTNSARFYYYNTRQQKTVWHRPQGCAVIPLAKLQTLKRRRRSQTSNTSLQSIDKKEISTQTQNSEVVQEISAAADDVKQADTTAENSDKLLTSVAKTKSTCSSSSSSSSPVVSATGQSSSSDDLFDDPSTQHKSCSRDAVATVPVTDAQRQRTNDERRTRGSRALDHTQTSDSERLQSSLGHEPITSQQAQSSTKQLTERCSQSPLISKVDSRHNNSCHGNNSIAAQTAAHVATFQITPTMRQRAFPRTNPAYIGTYRRDRPPTYRRLDAQSVTLGVASELRPSPVLNASNASNRPSSDGVQRALIQHTGDVVYLSTGGQRRVTSHQSTTVVAHQRSADWQTPTTRPQSDGATSRLRPDYGSGAADSADGLLSTSGVIRRQSEPDYVNIMSRHSHHHCIEQQQQQQQQPAMTASIRQSGDEYQWRSADNYRPSELLPSAIYMNQHELTITGRYTSRSTCNFMDPIANGHPEFDFDDSDRSSVYSTPSPQTRQFQTLAPGSVAMANMHYPPPASGLHGNAYRQPLALTAYHPSLRKKKWFDRQSSVSVMTARQSSLEKSWSLHAERPLSLLSPYSPQSSVIATKVADTLLQQMHIEQFVVENLNEHRKGILGKTMPVSHMLSWTKDVIQKPMIRTASKIVKKMAPEVFRLIQAYMGDRKAKETAMELALDVAVRGWSIVDLRDEIYIQLCRQTSKNPHEDSATLGWQLFGICLAFFPPSSKFYTYLDGHIHKNIDCYSHLSKQSAIYQYCTSCQKRLQWVVQVGAKRGLRKPNMDEVRQAKRSLIEPSMFGNSLSEIMLMQRDRYPERRLPWIQTALSEEVLRLNGHQTEGIFRVPGDIDEVNALKVHCDAWHLPSQQRRHGDDLQSSASATPDPHVPASLLKLWYRELSQPIVPFAFYERCINAYASADEACATVHLLPEINRLTLIYLIHFLQGFTRPEVVRQTKMDVNNIAMVWAPNCLRGLSNDPKIIFENTRREMGFIRTLILNLNTNEAVGLV